MDQWNLSEERNRVIGRSRVILQNWVALFGDDAAMRLKSAGPGSE